MEEETDYTVVYAPTQGIGELYGEEVQLGEEIVTPMLNYIQDVKKELDKRSFESGAFRNSDDGKFDIEGFTEPKCLDVYYRYMHKHRHLADGTLRDSDNWQRGIPQKEYVKSSCRHNQDVRLWNRGYPTRDGIIEAICGEIFNNFGLLKEIIEGRYTGELTDNDKELLQLENRS